MVGWVSNLPLRGCGAIGGYISDAHEILLLFCLRLLPFSSQELVQGDGQVSDADAGGVVDGVGDGRGGADDADLADPLGAHRVDVRVLLVEPGTSIEPTSALVAMWYSAKSWLTTCPNRGSSTLSSCSAIESPIVIPPSSCERAVLALMIRARVEHPEQARDAHLAGVLVHPHLGELRPEGVHRVVLPSSGLSGIPAW